MGSRYTCAVAEAASSDPVVERPYIFALLTLLTGVVVSGIVVLIASLSPEAMLIGLDGRHDAPATGPRLAACLDCHVPFVGSPGSRCLSPGCHGELATGTPPRTGPAMPVRFHVALRGVDCGGCHVEHGPASDRKGRPFAHALIPTARRAACARCHSAATEPNHTTTDAVQCDRCHTFDAWSGVTMKHDNVWQHACDICHVPPATPAHASVAGTCNACHTTEDWTPKPPRDPPPQ